MCVLPRRARSLARRQTAGTVAGKNRHRVILSIHRGHVGIAVAVLAIKYAAYYLTGSVALFSDAAESVVNVAASVAALLAVRISNMPADENHPYGHHKAEYFSAVLEGVLIIIAALAIVREAYSAFNEPKMFTDFVLRGKTPSFAIRPLTVLRYWKELVVENDVVEVCKQDGVVNERSALL